MELKGSCHCGAVAFSLQSAHPYPFNLCYCSVCRKTAGSGGYGINVGGEFDTLRIEGKEHVKEYQVKLDDKDTLSPARRAFCRHCATTLWVWDPRWPELVHPFASAIDTELPVPPERTHLMLDSKASWVEPHIGERDRTFDEYPEESLADWHTRLGV